MYIVFFVVLDVYCVEYYFDELKNWGIDFEIIKFLYEVVKVKGIDVCVIVIINLGNFIGVFLLEFDICFVIDFVC